MFGYEYCIKLLLVFSNPTGLLFFIYSQGSSEKDGYDCGGSCSSTCYIRCNVTHCGSESDCLAICGNDCKNTCYTSSCSVGCYTNGGCSGEKAFFLYKKHPNEFM